MELVYTSYNGKVWPSKCPADKPENGAAPSNNIVARHKLTMTQAGMTLNELMGKFPYIKPPEDPKHKIGESP